MIEGLKVTVKGSELKDLAHKQAIFHSERAEFYKRQVQEYEKFADQDSPSGSRQSPKEAASQKFNEHNIKYDYLMFVSSHLIESEDYLLSESDLVQLGIVKRTYF